MSELERSGASRRRINPKRAQAHFVGLKPHEAADLKVPAGKTETLDPGASKFERHFTRITPESIADVRKYLGPTIKEPIQRSAWATSPELDRQLISLDALEADDSETRGDARYLAYLASREIVGGGILSSYWHAVADRYLAISQAVLTIAVLRDIDVADRATLVVSGGIQALYARHIRIHGSGRIRCNGRLTVRATDLEGEWRWRLPTGEPVVTRVVSAE